MKQDFRELNSHGTPVFPLQVYSHHDQNGFYFVPQHWHDELEWIYVDTGILDLTVHGQSYTLKPGDFCFVNSGELHEIRSSGESYHHAIVFHPNMMDFAAYDICQHDLIGPVTNGKMLFPSAETIFSPSQKKKILSHMQEIVKMNQSQYKYAVLGIKIHIFAVLELLFQADTMKENLATTKTETSMNNLKRVLGYIEQNYVSTISLEQLAEIAYMSPNYFCHYFRKEIGKPPVAFINEFRIEKAAQLLSETDLQVSQIALSVGFENFSYFIRKFRECKSVTPKEYRSIWRKQNSK